MPAPKLGKDGRRRLTVTFVLVDDDADRLYALAAVKEGGGQHTSRLAGQIVRDALVYQAADPAVTALLRTLHRASDGRTDRPALRLVDESSLPD